MIIDKLIKRIIETKNPTVVGLDPTLDFVPEFIKAESFSKHGHTPKAVAEAFYVFNCRLIDSFCDIVPAVKPQVAMYEQYGSYGLTAYIDTIKYAKSKGLIVIGDIKRGDIGSTAACYANGHLGNVTISDKSYNIYNEDFVTINPYLGSDGIIPFTEECKKNNKGVFVLVKTSNPSSNELQDLMVSDKPLYMHTGELVEKWGKDLIGEYGFSSVGAVVGATYPEQGTMLRKQCPHTFFLIPGYGAQGATAKDLEGCFAGTSGGVKMGGIVNSSRGIIAAHLSAKYKNLVTNETDFTKATRAAVLDMKEDLA